MYKDHISSGMTLLAKMPPIAAGPQVKAQLMEDGENLQAWCQEAQVGFVVVISRCVYTHTTAAITERYEEHS